eukprot:CAMPEP_0202702918 /NCGR_PEP_ID=MMETSP1385-20130828/15835_1 /ASSEMBLY_ACC=CAM_ASM_000861 /TAXON_ID=933848 /ORGANISM="Elphidium margaritaceum" /LENGTH=150 /DNA_ID=CAMNT_0049360665 /DNA_START=1 /DNA_END=449 /DNA_ORIENTATION=+
MDCNAPSEFDYKTIDDWFDYIINITLQKQEWCSTDVGTNCADASVELTYDEIFGYITEVVVDRAAMAYDGGWSFTFDCLDVYQNGQNMNRSCNYTANINTTVSSISCNNCALLYDGCNNCVCSSDGSVACDSQWCNELAYYAEYTCNECV